MSLIRPFSALRPQTDIAAEVLSPPYDVVSTAEARQLAQHKPRSFLHISRAEIDLPPATNPYDAGVYQQAAATFNAYIADGVLQQEDKPCYYVYRLIMEGRIQIGLVAAASVAAYEANHIRKHEFTRPDKEDDRVRHIEALEAQTGPVLLFYPDSQTIDRLLAASLEQVPALDVVAHDGVRHSLWVVDDTATITALTAAFDALPALYIADGHHRSAAAARVARTMRSTEGTPGDDGRYEYFLTVSFPHHQMYILEYNQSTG